MTDIAGDDKNSVVKTDIVNNTHKKANPSTSVEKSAKYNTNTIPVKNETTVYITQPPKSTTPKKSELFGIETTNLTATGSLLTAFVSALVAYKTIQKYSKDYKLQLKQVQQSERDKKIDKAKHKIEHFYGPLHALLEESRVIYEHFAREEKEELDRKDSYFRTLRYLTHEDNLPKKGYNSLLQELIHIVSTNKKESVGLSIFKPHDQELLKHIIEISDKVVTLIEDNSGHVDNPALHTLLGKLAAHYRILRSASEGKLAGQSKFLEKIVFPLEINGAINSEISKLNRIIKGEEVIPISINKTIKFYNDNYLDYYHQTIDSEGMSFIYKVVRKYVSNGSEILDAGCGVGRDTKFFIQHGFKVTSFDASEKMVELCNEYPFAFCEHKSFQTINYPPIFDLVWACASLLHLDEESFKHALTNLHRALKPDGIIYFSIKSKVDNTKNNLRDFYIHSFSTISEILESHLKMTLITTWSSYSSISNTDKFINYIYQK